MDEDLVETWQYIASHETPFGIARLAKSLTTFCESTMSNPNAGMNEYGKCSHDTVDCTHKE